MTGYGRATASIGAEGQIEVAVRALNGRFFEPRIHAPREYASFESEVKKALSKRFARGTIDVYVNRTGTFGEVTAVVKVEVARAWLKGAVELRAALGLKDEPTLDQVLRHADAVQASERGEVGEAEKTALLTAITQASDACLGEREREGQALRVELIRLLTHLEQSSEKIESLRDEANAALATRYRERLQKFAVEAVVEPQRIAQEIAALLERADISEEIARLREHLATYRKLLDASDAQGKKMDFYAQELLRETNTIGSKSQASRLTDEVVQAKALIERVREQVQNVE